MSDPSPRRRKTGTPDPGAPGKKGMRVLVADDDQELRDLLRMMLARDGYSVDLAADGAEALELVGRKHHDLVLLDVDMPRKNGWEVVQVIKADPLLRHLPVLFLTSMTQVRSKVRGLTLGAADYITKPFHPRELLARIESALRDAREDLEANPLTGLPGNPAIEREFMSRVRSGEPFAVLFADLNNFKAFNDRFGFNRGDAVLRRAAKTLLAAAGPADFVGHIGGDDFILVTTPDRAEEQCRRIVRAFGKTAPTFYDAAARRKGYIEMPDRRGRMTRFPFVGIALGAVTSVERKLTSVGQISSLGAELKKLAKSAQCSYAFDRRLR
jgi:PleD family two-component response regulator